MNAVILSSDFSSITPRCVYCRREIELENECYVITCPYCRRNASFKKVALKFFNQRYRNLQVNLQRNPALKTVFKNRYFIIDNALYYRYTAFEEYSMLKLYHMLTYTHLNRILAFYEVFTGIFTKNVNQPFKAISSSNKLSFILNPLEARIPKCLYCHMDIQLQNAGIIICQHCQRQTLFEEVALQFLVQRYEILKRKLDCALALKSLFCENPIIVNGITFYYIHFEIYNMRQLYALYSFAHLNCALNIYEVFTDHLI